MNFVNVRELHIDTTKVLSKVKKGTKFIVTNHGKPQAILSPFSKEDLMKEIPIKEILYSSESSLRKDWLRPEEDLAWKDL